MPAYPISSYHLDSQPPDRFELTSGRFWVKTQTARCTVCFAVWLVLTFNFSDRGQLETRMDVSETRDTLK